jgi:hypothetical protein
MEEVLVVLKNLEHENQTLREFCCSFPNQSSFDLFGLRFGNTTLTKGIINQPT